jgi:septal ring factor EnvC (AmiA/AmiB activator)
MKYIILLNILLISVLVFAQDRRAELETDKQRLEEEIRYTNQLIQNTRSTRKSSLNELSMLSSKISKREELIAAIGSELYFIELQIADYSDSIKVLSDDLRLLKEEYARMIYYAYKNQDLYNRMMFIFASDNINQAYQRLKYFQHYNSYRKKQAELIVSTSSSIQQKSDKLEEIRSDKKELLSSLEDERSTLIRDKRQKDQKVQELSQKEQELIKSLREKEKAAQKLQNAIERIIAEELRKAEEARKAGEMALTPEEMALSDNLQENRGKLPWPLEKGILSSTFGEHRHPVLKNVKTKNNGINILTEKGATARAVFDGEVTRVLSVPNNNNVIIVRHGEYLTVYSNLDEVFVSQGDKVTTKQPIGTVFTNPDENRTELHFEVWKAKTLLNPSSWIMRIQ